MGVQLIRPNKLRVGDTIATVSLSWGGAGDERLLWRYQVGKKRLEEQFGLKVIEMENTLKGSRYLYKHPEKRAQDLMEAFKNPEVKAILSCIGGDESIRLLPYINIEVIRKNPKIFLGYSDSTITHLMCLKAGISSFYGPSILAEFAENGKIFDYTTEHIQRILFNSNTIGEIPVASEWTGEIIEWSVDKSKELKKLKRNTDYVFLQGKGKWRGYLIGGCIEVLEMAKGTELWPDIKCFEDAILFFETSEDTPHPSYMEYWLRNYGSQGILQKARGIIFGKPYQEKYYEEYKEAILKIVHELNLLDIPIIYNMSFGHNQPMCIIPYGAEAEIDCNNKTFSIVDTSVS